MLGQNGIVHVTCPYLKMKKDSRPRCQENETGKFLIKRNVKPFSLQYLFFFLHCIVCKTGVQFLFPSSFGVAISRFALTRFILFRVFFPSFLGEPCKRFVKVNCKFYRRMPWRVCWEARVRFLIITTVNQETMI